MTISDDNFQEKLRKDSPTGRIAAIMLFSDSTVLSGIGGKGVHAVYMYLGNHPINYRRKLTNGAIIMVAYLPKLPSAEDMGVTTARHSALQRILFQEAMKVLLSPLIKLGKQYDIFFPFLRGQERQYAKIYQ